MATAAQGVRGPFGRIMLGTAAGSALVVVSGSLLVWPAADLVLGPQLVRFGMRVVPAPSPSGSQASVSPEVADIIRGLDASTGEAAGAAIVSGGGGVGKQLERAVAGDRPVVYISLREATSPHDLFFAMVTGVYSADRLGVVGTWVHSAGIWWTVLFDVIVGHEPEQTRAFHCSVVLQHLKRALRMAGASGSPKASRPLVIVDYFDEAARHAKPSKSDAPSVMMRGMLLHFAAWCAAVCFDQGLADLVLCRDSAPGGTWWPWGGGNVIWASSAPALQLHLKRWMT